MGGGQGKTLSETETIDTATTNQLSRGETTDEVQQDVPNAD